MKKINITITGALGRMGKILINRISKNKNLKLISLTDIRIGQKIKGIKIQNNSNKLLKKLMLSSTFQDQNLQLKF